MQENGGSQTCAWACESLIRCLTNIKRASLHKGGALNLLSQSISHKGSRAEIVQFSDTSNQISVELLPSCLMLTLSDIGQSSTDLACDHHHANVLPILGSHSLYVLYESCEDWHRWISISWTNDLRSHRDRLGLTACARCIFKD